MRHRYIFIWAVTLAIYAPVHGQYSQEAFNVKKASELYDERGFTENSTLTLDGSLAISNQNGNVSYSYPISRFTKNGYDFAVDLNYCGAVAFTAFNRYTQPSPEAVHRNAAWERFSNNRPAWLVGLNGICIQAIHTTGQFYSDPQNQYEGGPFTYTNDHINWVIDGLDFNNRMSAYGSGEGDDYLDAIRILQSDGSLLELYNFNRAIAPWDPRLFTGYYFPRTANASEYAVVEFDATYWTPYPYIRQGQTGTGPNEIHIHPRVMRLYRGDGLEYVFREWPIPYGLKYFSDVEHGNWGPRPTIFYLEEINSANGNLLTLERTRHYPYPGYPGTDWSGQRDMTIGRAATVGFAGHRFTYDFNSLSIEALERTLTARFDSVMTYGRAKDVERAPFAANASFWHTETQSAVRAEHHATRHFASYLGMITAITDAEGRRTRFEYETYTRTHDDIKFPRPDAQPGERLEIKNYRLTKVHEPGSRTEIDYYGALSMNVPPNPDRLIASQRHALSNVVSQTRRYDTKTATLLTTGDYSYNFHLGDPPQTSFTLTDNVTDSVRTTSYSYQSFTMPETISWQPDARHTVLAAVAEEAAGLVTRTLTDYQQFSGYSHYVILPVARTEQLIRGLDTFRTAQEYYSYALDTIQSFGIGYNGDNLTQIFGHGIVSKTTERARPDDGTTTLTGQTETFVHLPFAADTLTRIHAEWNKYATLQSYYHHKKVLQDFAGTWEEFLMDENNVIWDSSGTQPEEIRFAPVLSLPATRVVRDASGAILGGSIAEYEHGLRPDITPRGKLTATAPLGVNGDTLLPKTTYRYRGGWTRNLRSGVTDPQGARVRNYISYGAAGAVDFGAGSQGLGAYDKLLDDDNPEPGTLRGSVPYRDGPLAERRYVRRFQPSGALDTLELVQAFERNAFDQVSGTLDANGQYNRYWYDGNGRIRAVWQPGDFPSDAARRPQFAQTEILQLGARTVRRYRYDTVHCWQTGTAPNLVNHSEWKPGPWEEQEDTKLFRATDLYRGRQACPCESSGLVHPDGKGPAATGGGGPTAQESCNATAPYLSRDTRTIELIYHAAPDDAIQSAIRIDSLKLQLLVTGVEGECVTLEIACPDLNLIERYMLNCSLLVDPEWYNWYDKRRPLLEVDLLPHVGAITALAAGEQLTFEIRVQSVQGAATLAGEALDAMPALIVTGDLAEVYHLADYTAEFRYDDDNLTASVYTKIDDRLHTADWLDTAAMPTYYRSAETLRAFGAAGRIDSSGLRLGPDYAPVDTAWSRTDYSGSGRPLTATDAAGYRVATEYDAAGRALKTTHQDSAQTIRAYTVGREADFGLSEDYYGVVHKTLTTGPEGRQTARFEDAFGRLRREVTGAGGLELTTLYDYDVQDRLTEVVSPAGDTTFYWYDAFGRTRYTYQPDMGYRSYAYDKLGNVRFAQTQAQADSNKLSFMEYDDLGRVVLIGEARIDTAGLGGGGEEPLTNAKAGRNAQLQAAPFNLNRLTDLIDARVLQNGHAGDPVTANRTIWDGTGSGFADGFSESICMPAGIGGAGEQAQLSLPLLSRPIDENAYYERPVTAAANPDDFEDIGLYPQHALIVVHYDELPSSTGTIWGALPAAATWDALAPTGTVRHLKGREAATAYRGHGGEPFHYVVSSYDERGRIESLLRYTENLGFDAVYYRYNASNQPYAVTVADPQHSFTTWYAFDDAGRIDSVWSQLGDRGTGLGVSNPAYPTPLVRAPGMPADMAYSYDARGQIDTLRHPAANVQVAYDYAPRAWLDTLEVWRTGGGQPIELFREAYRHDSSGLLTWRGYTIGGVAANEHVYVYDGSGRLTEWEMHGTPARSELYYYDAVGNRDSVFKGAGAAELHAYTYGNAAHPNQLTRVTGSATRTDYGYDPDGAQITRTRYSANGPLWGPVADETFGYNAQGLVEQYAWSDPLATGGGPAVCDAFTKTPNFIDWRYRYNPAGEREQKRLYYSADGDSCANAHSWVYYLLAGTRQLAVYHGVQTTTRQCLTDPEPVEGDRAVYFYPTEYLTYGAGGVRAMTTRPNIGKEYMVRDALGSTRLVIDQQTGNIADMLDYAPFGEVVTTAGSGERLTFIGKEQDAENALRDHGVRKYDEETGRFISTDALWEKFRAHTPYHYSYNDPLQYKDPNGNQANMAERWLAIQHPIDAAMVKWNASEAKRITESKFKDPKSLEGGEGDAFRHALWSAMNARDVGFERAKEFTDAHEDFASNTEASKQMDLFNNAVGLEIGADPKNAEASDERLVTLVELKRVTNQLQTAVDPNLSNESASYAMDQSEDTEAQEKENNEDKDEK